MKYEYYFTQTTSSGLIRELVTFFRPLAGLKAGAKWKQESAQKREREKTGKEKEERWNDISPHCKIMRTLVGISRRVSNSFSSSLYLVVVSLALCY